MTINQITSDAAAEGDLVFFDSPGPVSWLLRMAQRIRWSGDKSHVAWLDYKDAENHWVVGQAEGKGVTNDKLLELGAKDVIVRLPSVCNRDKTLAFLRAQVGRKYGFVTDASIFVTLLAPGFFDVMLPNTWICSAVVAEGLRFGGWYHTWDDIYQVAPDELFTALAEQP